MTLVEFLLARISEDEVEAMRGLAELDPGQTELDVTIWDLDTGIRYRPARVLADCRGLREIVALFTHNGRTSWDQMDADNQDVLRLLTNRYADHPDYDANWRL